MRTSVIGLILFLISFGFYLCQMAPSVTAGDSGEFMTAAATLSLSHAPSYPLFSVLGRFFMDLIPWGAVGYQMNLFSVFCAALTLMFLFMTSLRLGLGPLMAVLLSLMFGVTDSFWLNSLITEVFPLNTLVIVLLLFLLAGLSRAVTFRDIVKAGLLLGFILGLGLGNHHVLVFFLPAILVFIPKIKNVIHFGQFVLLFTLLGLLGFSIYAFLPIRSAQDPPLNWGQPTTVNRFYRTLARKDYGSTTLALGEAPERTWGNTFKHAKNFSLKMEKEFPLFILLIMLGSLFYGAWRENVFYKAVFILFCLSGPGFYLLGNLPFDAQSEGIIGRFFIFPVLVLVVGSVPLLKRLKKTAPLLIGLGIILAFPRSYSEAAAHRQGFLVVDYGQAMLRTLPPNGMLFMDGGDDAFYSLAMLHYAENIRPDTELHDRGGLVYKNIYGSDFRKLKAKQKETRRLSIEKTYLDHRKVFYSTMNPKVRDDIPLEQKGFLIQAKPDPLGMSWPIVILRSLYPLTVADYRTRALGAFFPYMRGRQLILNGNLEEGLRFFWRAQTIGKDVGWLITNVEANLSLWAFKALSENRLAEAEQLYDHWLRFNPLNSQALGNMGVVYERQGRIEKAKVQYKKTMELLPQAVDPVYNLAVLNWHEQKWPIVIDLFKEVLRRDPNHQSAQRFLTQAQRNLRK